jgi:hypothetical protein
MNEPMIVALAVCRGRTLDQPDLANHLTAQSAWQAWTPVEELLELPREAEELIDAASASLGHLTGGWQRRHAWECAEAGAWGLASPLPHLSDRFHRARQERPGVLQTLIAHRRRRHRSAQHPPTGGGTR